MSNRHKLEEYNNGEYVFHGSDKNIERLEPRQAYDWVNSKKTKDGKPAVFATDNLDRAIFMALLRNIPGEHGSELRNGKTILIMNKGKQQEIKKARDLRGYVMVLPKERFEEFGNDFRSELAIEPKFIAEVNKSDLPQNIVVYN